MAEEAAVAAPEAPWVPTRALATPADVDAFETLIDLYQHIHALPDPRYCELVAAYSWKHTSQEAASGVPGFLGNITALLPRIRFVPHMKNGAVANGPQVMATMKTPAGAPDLRAEVLPESGSGPSALLPPLSFVGNLMYSGLGAGNFRLRPRGAFETSEIGKARWSAVATGFKFDPKVATFDVDRSFIVLIDVIRRLEMAAVRAALAFGVGVDAKHTAVPVQLSTKANRALKDRAAINAVVRSYIGGLYSAECARSPPNLSAYHAGRAVKQDIFAKPSVKLHDGCEAHGIDTTCFLVVPLNAEVTKWAGKDVDSRMSERAPRLATPGHPTGDLEKALTAAYNQVTPRTQRDSTVTRCVYGENTDFTWRDVVTSDGKTGVRDVSRFHPEISNGTLALVVFDLSVRYFESARVWGTTCVWKSVMPLRKTEPGFVPLVGAGSDNVAAEYAAAEDSLVSYYKRMNPTVVSEPVLAIAAGGGGADESWTRTRPLEHEDEAARRGSEGDDEEGGGAGRKRPIEGDDDSEATRGGGGGGGGGGSRKRHIEHEEDGDAKAARTAAADDE